MPATRRPLRILAIAATLAAGSATAAGPALAAKSGHGGPGHGKTAAAKTAKKAKPGRAADLVTRDLSFEVFSASIEVEAEIANTGQGRANRSEATVAISGDATLSADDDIVATSSTNRIRGGDSTDLSTEFEIPETLPEGDLYLLVCADGRDAVKERVESNNCASELIASAEDDVATDDEGDDVAEDEDDAADDA